MKCFKHDGMIIIEVNAGLGGIAELRRPQGPESMAKRTPNSPYDVLG
jgi:hypothetical protein